MQFSRIRLENWRNFSEVDVALQTRAFLVGANATGKSNFLDVFRFLRDLVVPGGGFQEAVNRRGGVSIIRNLAARYPRTNVEIDVDLQEGDETLWRYRIVFNEDNNHRPVLREEKIWHKGQSILDRLDKDDEKDEARLSQTQLEQTFANVKFREIAEFFKSVSYSHVVPQFVRDPERSLGRQADPYGADLFEQIAKAPQKPREKRLQRILSALRLAVPQLTALQLLRDNDGSFHLRAQFRQGASTAPLTEREFSDGTLRLLGLLWALQEGTGTLLLEEPELSLHPSVVRNLPQMMHRIRHDQNLAQRQIIVSTHSSDLLRDEGIAPDEVLLFTHTQAGVQVKVGVSLPEIERELAAGLTMADIVLPRTEPPNIRELAVLSE
jgi:predicted ATPase